MKGNKIITSSIDAKSKAKSKRRFINFKKSIESSMVGSRRNDQMFHLVIKYNILFNITFKFFKYKDFFLFLE